MNKNRIKILIVTFTIAFCFLTIDRNEKTSKSKKAKSLLVNLALTGTNQNLPTEKDNQNNALETRAVVSPITGTTRSNFVKLEIQAANSFITDASIRSAKYADMKVSSFDFYRATAHLYHKDLKSMPNCCSLSLENYHRHKDLDSRRYAYLKCWLL